MSPILPPKKDVALALLERASVFVHLDPRGDGVVVPAWLKKQPQLVLQIGLNMAVKIPDLEVVDDAVSCTLSFSRRPHFCYVPWGSVYALVGEDGRGMVWPEDIPPEVAAETQVANRRGGLHAVDADAPAEEPRARSRSRSERPSQRPSLVALDGERLDRSGRPAAAADDETVRDGEMSQASVNAVIDGGPDDSVNESAKLRPSERPYLRLVK